MVQAVGVIEANKPGTPLTGVKFPSPRSVEGLPLEVPAVTKPLPFAYESTGDSTRFTSLFDPDPRSREVFWFHQPVTLAGWLAEWTKDLNRASLRARLRQMPRLDAHKLWAAQQR